jgi:hypothetical protein
VGDIDIFAVRTDDGKIIVRTAEELEMEGGKEKSGKEQGTTETRKR